jgi:O-methyltransferase/aklanonic acid methyltransferase
MASPQKQRVQAFFNGLAASYDTVIPFFETFADHLVTIAGIRSGDRVLDLACGTGRCTRAAARLVGRDGLVVGTDLATEMAGTARAHARDEGLTQAAVGVLDAEHLGLRPGSFEVVTCGFGVFFFPEPVRALAECRRVLRPGGRFAATTFADGVAGYQWANEVTTVLGRDHALPPSAVLTHDGLETALEDAGFDEVTSTSVEGHFVFPDVDAYLAWCWVTGTRRVLATMSDEELDRFRTLSAERLDAHEVPGGFELRQPANVTVGRRA